MVLSDAPNGASFKVIKVILGREVGKRLADMGFTEGAAGAVVRSGFLRGPLQVRIRGYDILIRRCEAAAIEVEPVGDWSAAADAAGIFGMGFGAKGGRSARGEGRGGWGGSGHGKAGGAGRARRGELKDGCE